MRTNKPISTISYNSEKWLCDVLERLISASKIDYAYYIRHKGENGDKDHIHVYIAPNVQIDTLALRNSFNEPDPPNPKPLGVLPFQKSDKDHWLRYAVHDPLYLKMHNSDNDGDGKIGYKVSDIKCVNVPDEQLQRDFKHSESVIQTKTYRAAKRLAMGGSATDTVLLDGLQPTQALFMAKLMMMDGKNADALELVREIMQEERKNAIRNIVEQATSKGVEVAETSDKDDNMDTEE